MAREALEIAERIDDPALATMAASGLHILAAVPVIESRPTRRSRRQIEHTERARQPLLVFVLANALALRAIGEGRLDEGERLAEDMLEVGSESGQPDALVWMSGHVGLLWEEGRRADEANAMLHRGGDGVADRGSDPRPHARRARRDRPGARAVARPDRRRVAPICPRTCFGCFGTTSLAAASWFLDDPTYAAELAEQLERLAG